MFFRKLQYFDEIVPIKDVVWKYINVLQEMIEIALKNSFCKEDLLLFTEKITHHHKLYLNLFPNEKLKPKHHLFTHYPKII